MRSERSKRIANPSKQHNPPKCLRGCQRVASIRYAVHGQGIKNEIGINGKSMSRIDKVRKRQSGLRILATRGMQNCRCCWSLVVAKCSAVRGYASAMESKATSCRSFARKRVLGIYLVAGLPLVARSLWPIWHSSLAPQQSIAHDWDKKMDFKQPTAAERPRFPICAASGHIFLLRGVDRCFSPLCP